MKIDDILEKFNLKYEDLTAVERETLNTWLEALDKSKLTLQGVKTYIATMRDAVEQELTKESMKRPSFWAFVFNFRKDNLLKARLRNYMLLEAFLSTPEKARQALERAMTGIAGRREVK